MYFLHVYAGDDPVPGVEQARNRTEVLLTVSRLISQPRRPERIVFYRDARPLFVIDKTGVTRIGKPGRRL
jgi:hypothetical protein